MFLKTSEKTVEKLKKTLFVSEKTEKKLKKLLHFLFFDSFFACFSKHFRVVSISSETTVILINKTHFQPSDRERNPAIVDTAIESPSTTPPPPTTN